MSRAAFWSSYTALAGRGWIVGAWLLGLAALGTVAAWVHEPWQAIEFSIMVPILPALGAWLAPLGGLLLQARASHQLRLPRGRPLLRGRVWLLLALNLLPASVLIFAVAQDADWALFKVLQLLCFLLLLVLLLLLPVIVLAFAGLLPMLIGLAARALPPIAWTNPLRIAATAALALGLVVVLRALVRRYLRRSAAAAGPGACLLDHLAGWGDLAAQMVRSQADAPNWMLARVRVRPGEPVRRRVAHLLGQPYAPGFMRRTLGMLGAVLLGGALFAWLWAAFGPSGWVGTGLTPQWLFLMGVTWMALSVPWAAVLRLATLYGASAAEFTELRLLPGQGGARACARRVGMLMIARLLQGQVILAAGPTLALLWAGATAALPPVLAGFALLAALALMENVRYLQRGRGWLPTQWATLLLGFVLVGGVQVLVLRASPGAEDAAFTRAFLAAAVLLLAWAAWRAWRALQRLDLDALAPPADRAARAVRAAPA